MILSSKVTSLKRSTLTRFCCDASLSAKHPGEFWRKMKPLLPTSSGKNIQGVILVEGSSVVSDPGFVVEVFSDYFAWKPARLTPVFKQGIDKDKANCHPVSILTSLSKHYGIAPVETRR